MPTQPTSIFEKIVDALLILLAIGLLGWSGYRAATLSMTIDEGVTFLVHVPHSVFEIFFSPDCFRNANNHILNTLSIKFFTGLFQTNHEWAVRFGSVVAHAIFLLFSWRLVRLLTQNPLARLTGFVLLNVNVYMLDFFSMARGYGLSLAFIMVALFYTFRFYLLENQRDTRWASLAVGLAILSNFTAFNFFAVWWAMLNLGAWFCFGRKKWATDFLKINLPAAVLAVSCALFLGRQIGWLRASDEFKYGADSLLYSFQQLVDNSMNDVHYFPPDTNFIFTRLIFWALLVASVGSFAFSFWKKKGQKPLATLAALFPAILLLGLLVQYYWLGTKFLVQRTSLVFLPLSALALWLFLVELDDRAGRWLRWLPQILLTVFAIFPVYHAVRACKLAATREWYFDEFTKDMCAYVADSAKKEGHSMSLRTYWLYDPGASYYQKTYFPNEIEPTIYLPNLARDSASIFYYVEESQLPQMNSAYEEVKRFGGWRVLLRRKQ